MGSHLLNLQTDLVMCNIGAFLNPKHYQLLSSTCKHLRERIRFDLDATDIESESLLHLNSNINQIFFRQTGCLFFGSEEWQQAFNITIEDTVLLDLATYRILNSECPFNPSKKVNETHALMYIPSKIGGASINMAMLSRLCPSIVQDPDPEVWGGNLDEMLLAEDQDPSALIPDDYPGVGRYTSRLNWIGCGKAVDLTVSRSFWMLFYIGEDHGLIPGSRGKSFVQHLNILNEVNQDIHPEAKLSRNGELLFGSGYQVLSNLEIAIAAMLIFTKTRKRIIPSSPPTYSLTRYYAANWNRIIIGKNNDSEGLFGFYCTNRDDEIGICAARML